MSTERDAVKAYLTMIDHIVLPRGVEPLTVEELQARIDAEPNKVKRLALIQKRMDRERTLYNSAAVEAITDAFVKYAGTYAAEHGISYAAWRSVGVSAAVLKRAGIQRVNGTHPAPA